MAYDMKLPDAIDLSHHLSEVARAREISPLKDLQQYLGRDDLLSIAGGLPHPDFFPFDKISATVYSKDVFPTDSPVTTLSLFSRIAQFFGKGRDEINIKRYAKQAGDLSLAESLQYGLSSGQPGLQGIIREIVHRIYKPAYRDWTILIHSGNTDGWGRAVMTLCDPGDVILACEWTYPSAMAASRPLGITAVSVAADEGGMRSDALLETLSSWDEKERGAPRPRVMYTIPVGQNPTGSTMSIERKKRIYDICVEYDIVIVEDDPYYFLQEGQYHLPQVRPVESKELSNDAFIASLVPSYVSIDYQGRVVRLDSFSKTVAPGCRLGWFTCNPLFRERFERQGETSVQAACGFSQALVAALLMKWGIEGYIRWLRGLRGQYRKRRDFCIDCFAESFELKASTVNGHQTTYDGYIRREESTYSKRWQENFMGTDDFFPVISFMPPTSGMFLWIQVNFQAHPSSSQSGKKDLELQLLKKFVDAGILVAPGSIFSADGYGDDSPGHLRLSFSNAELPVLKKAIGTMAAVLEKFFYGEDQL
ncbi:hypothetical protein AGABI1DRAFT_113513 [Agaricus bisporus var. burnettii JB137-S8]|uniref:Aminotransferase class I/classII large domain-containing protein n=1 Tax=Agaricus bisporus var. burnettii (strain JB137-S8 / ATCC MYA-4627 / FGSC 10392) TaxID=597362 RepID=K5XY93_AGABU|nr:uncharacterized protein AGABI1DRAFT_113513 [Agaricus bisporus var. burnettii JB137-S8]EKM80315.1 hypothetical protein AGABI1DRAFT_113513 [Agaricus bisporus var. burnettii JB137-S8]